jgi:hypothetical protein
MATPLRQSTSRSNFRRRSSISAKPLLKGIAESDGDLDRTIHPEEGTEDHIPNIRKYWSSDKSPSHPHRQRRRTPLSLLPLLSLSLIPLASAAPPLHTRPSSTPTSNNPFSRPSRPTRRALHTPLKRDNHVAYITSAAPPSALPSNVVLMDETALPYIVTQGSDGLYTKVDDGWRLYGRQSGVRLLSKKEGLKADVIGISSICW